MRVLDTVQCTLLYETEQYLWPSSCAMWIHVLKPLNSITEYFREQIPPKWAMPATRNEYVLSLSNAASLWTVSTNRWSTRSRILNRFSSIFVSCEPFFLSNFPIRICMQFVRRNELRKPRQMKTVLEFQNFRIASIFFQRKIFL